MNNKELLQKATSIYDIAKALHYKPSGLSYLIYKFDEPKPKYTEFEIEKKSGGKRKIKKPHDKIAKLQKTLLNLLNDIYEPKKCVQGFVKYNRNGNQIKRNIITNAELHSSKKYIINLDIQDFFPSINFGRVRGMFISKPYLFSAKASTIMAQIACDKNELPVGSPCSPIIANMVAEHLDYDIIKYIAKSKCNITYTRYADDMVFSFNNEKHMNCIFNAEQNKVSYE
jgi:RNA-directed DNA polymerase